MGATVNQQAATQKYNETKLKYTNEPEPDPKNQYCYAFNKN
jgi:hypothetical protein